MGRQVRGRQEIRGSAGDLASQFRNVEELLGSRRAELTTRLQRMRFGQRLSLELNGGERVSGRLRGCNGVRIVMSDGRSIPIASVRALSELPSGVDGAPLER